MIFFDFDGTIVDVWRRYYQVFVTASRASDVSFSSYVSNKRRLCKDDLVAEQLGAVLPTTYYSEKRELLEKEEFLLLDQLLVSAEDLRSVFRRHNCHILTNRRKPAAFYNQISAMGLSDLLERSIVLNPDQRMSKKDYLSQLNLREKIIVVGDSLAEYETLALPNVHVILVKTGLQSPEIFPTHERCQIVASIADVITI